MVFLNSILRKSGGPVGADYRKIMSLFRRSNTLADDLSSSGFYGSKTASRPRQNELFNSVVKDNFLKILKANADEHGLQETEISIDEVNFRRENSLHVVWSTTSKQPSADSIQSRLMQLSSPLRDTLMKKFGYLPPIKFISSPVNRHKEMDDIFSAIEQERQQNQFSSELDNGFMKQTSRKRYDNAALSPADPIKIPNTIFDVDVDQITRRLLISRGKSLDRAFKISHDQPLSNDDSNNGAENIDSELAEKVRAEANFEDFKSRLAKFENSRKRKKKLQYEKKKVDISIGTFLRISD